MAEPTNKPDVDEEELDLEDHQDDDEGASGATGADNQDDDEGATGPDSEDDDEGASGADEDDEEDEDEPKPPSRRESLRIQQLLAKMKEGTPSPKKQPKADTSALDYKEALDADDEVIEKLKTDRDSFGERMYQQGLEQAKSIQFQTRLEVDAPKVEAKYPILDKDSDEFHPALAESINLEYLALVGYDSKTGSVRTADIRYSDFVEARMEQIMEAAKFISAETRENVKKQAASAAIRPGGGTPKRMNFNKAPEAMTDEELDAIIAASVPPKSRK